ncbi:hypothetical protein CLAFUW4_09351 [Fulvia fulva]|uniref:Uncharacterized protein n=1 Tax=Passalora fulva TaxID=5499 RepID=A0A9Q8PH25_PASFU|nr:uncharacterized protein CLAFUR5_09451 [Fulvia fulva]KAK4614206.1 hypothetical protein CLAFUR4_09357 [Fulvia fulva]KAK4614366.1 hypothetical protein CLAFUR0_09349 [Fulvia fulva]UJO22371.1 hypothetical protein CLAFUR5_09451 [Fulvia fulva]WPV20464.1 hypothetical protein CLAFUW4_09351 [Fulvia fulva]WPV35383.1 hypothetical protein CLAFUW7_09352 [Fulvia fulva]
MDNSTPTNSPGGTIHPRLSLLGMPAEIRNTIYMFAGTRITATNTPSRTQARPSSPRANKSAQKLPFSTATIATSSSREVSTPSTGTAPVPPPNGPSSQKFGSTLQTLGSGPRSHPPTLALAAGSKRGAVPLMRLMTLVTFGETFRVCIRGGLCIFNDRLRVLLGRTGRLSSRRIRDRGSLSLIRIIGGVGSVGRTGEITSAFVGSVGSMSPAVNALTRKMMMIGRGCLSLV